MVRKYTGFGDEMSQTVALTQAGLLLDIAAVEAISRKSLEDMANIAAGWMELASRLSNPEEEEVELESEPGYKMGFRPNEVREEELDEDEYEPEEVPLVEPGE